MRMYTKTAINISKRAKFEKQTRNFNIWKTDWRIKRDVRDRVKKLDLFIPIVIFLKLGH